MNYHDDYDYTERESRSDDIREGVIMHLPDICHTCGEWIVKRDEDRRGDIIYIPYCERYKDNCKDIFKTCIL